MAKTASRNLTTGSPTRLVIGFLLPLLGGLLFQQLYNMVDTLVVGRFLGMDALAGVGSTSSVNFLVLGFCIGICNGFVIPVAQKFGEGDEAELRRFVANRQDEEAACAMMLGSNFAGISFAWARLGNVHAMSHPVSAYFNVPHGVANSILLPNVVEYNALADHGRYEVIYNYIREGNGPIENFTPDMLVEELRHLNEQLGIPATLSEVGVTADKIPAMAEDAMKGGNIPANPRQSTVKDIIKLYEKTM